MLKELNTTYDMIEKIRSLLPVMAALAPSPQVAALMTEVSSYLSQTKAVTVSTENTVDMLQKRIQAYIRSEISLNEHLLGAREQVESLSDDTRRLAQRVAVLTDENMQHVKTIEGLKEALVIAEGECVALRAQLKEAYS